MEPVRCTFAGNMRRIDPARIGAVEEDQSLTAPEILLAFA